MHTGKRLLLQHLSPQRRGGAGKAVLRLANREGPPGRGPQGQAAPGAPKGGNSHDIPPQEESQKEAPEPEDTQEGASAGDSEKGSPREEASREGASKEGLQGCAGADLANLRGGPEPAEELCGVWFVGGSPREVGLVTERGIVSRLSVSSIPVYSNKLAKGVFLQRLREAPKAADAAATAVLLSEQHKSKQTAQTNSASAAAAAAAAASARFAAAREGVSGGDSEAPTVHRTIT